MMGGEVKALVWRGPSWMTVDEVPEPRSLCKTSVPYPQLPSKEM